LIVDGVVSTVVYYNSLVIVYYDRLGLSRGLLELFKEYRLENNADALIF